MPVTPVFGWPYQHRREQPGFSPEAIEKLALAIEATLVSSGIPRMGCSIRRAANQTLPDVTFTDISWDTKDTDTNGLFPANGTTVTIPAGGDGLWAITVSVTTAAAPTGLALVQMNLAGNAYRAAFSNDTCGATFTLPLAAGTPIVTTVYMDTAAGTTMTARLHAYRVGL